MTGKPGTALPVEAPTRTEGVVVAAFVAAVFIGGANFVAVRFSNAELSPFWGAGLRFAVSAVLLALLGLVLRVPFPRGRTLAGATLFGLFGFAAFYAFAYVGLLEAPAGLAAVVLSSVPLTTLLLAIVQRQERFRWRGLIGAVLALAGIAVMFGTPGAAGVSLGSLLALVAASVAAGEAGVVAKWFPRSHPVTMNAVAMAVGSALLLALSLVAGEPKVLPVRAATWTAFAYLVVVGSVGLFVLYLFVLKRWTASRTAYQFVLFPVVAATLGAWLEGAPITPSLAMGALVVLAGVYIGALHGAMTGAPAEQVRFPRER